MNNDAGIRGAADLPAIAPSAVAIPATRRAPVRRKLHLGHFGFMRATVQGIGWEEAWDRYLRIEGARGDQRVIRHTVAWLRDEMAVAARRYDRHGIARLLLVDAHTVEDKPGQSGDEAPSLDDFAAERGLDDFSLEEIHYQYIAEFGKQALKPSRRERLIKKQLDAILWLENLAAERPLARDGVVCWFTPPLAARIEQAGLTTLAELIARINGVGLNWWRSLPAIGAGKAQRIVEWLDLYADTIGLAIRPHARVQRSAVNRFDLQTVVKPHTGVVPLEKLIVPPDLDGSTGIYRVPKEQSTHRLNTDIEAILYWIKTKHGLSPEKFQKLKDKRGQDAQALGGPLDWRATLSNTQRAYLREAERFLLWAVNQRKKAMSSMSLEDCAAYLDFLADPQPKHLWCGARSHERWGPAWRPFAGPLSPSAQKTAITILKSMYRWLNDALYLRGNPWVAVTTPKSNGRKIDVGRSFTQTQWDWILACAANLPPSSANTRLQVALRLLISTGLRLSEVVDAKVGDLEWKTYPADSHSGAVSGWKLTVVGKGQKTRDVPVPDFVVDDLERYLSERGFTEGINAVPHSVFLLGQATDIAERAPWSPLAKAPVNPHDGIDAGTLYEQLKRFFGKCAKAIANQDDAARLNAASVHWLRHTHGSQANAAGVDLKSLQQTMGHASISTTSIYTTTEAKRQMQEMSKLWKYDQSEKAPVNLLEALADPVATSPVRGGLRLVASDGVALASHTAQLTLTLKVENESKFARGKHSAREFIVKECLRVYLVRRIDGERYRIAISYASDDDLNMAVDELLADIRWVAQQRDCAVTAELHDENSDRYWP